MIGFVVVIFDLLNRDRIKIVNKVFFKIVVWCVRCRVMFRCW